MNKFVWILLLQLCCVSGHYIAKERLSTILAKIKYEDHLEETMESVNCRRNTNDYIRKLCKEPNRAKLIKLANVLLDDLSYEIELNAYIDVNIPYREVLRGTARKKLDLAMSLIRKLPKI